MGHDSPARPAKVEQHIDVTREMIEAGVAELRAKVYGEPLSEVAYDVFLAMASASKTNASA